MGRQIQLQNSFRFFFFFDKWCYKVFCLLWVVLDIPRQVYLEDQDQELHTRWSWRRLLRKLKGLRMDDFRVFNLSNCTEKGIPFPWANYLWHCFHSYLSSTIFRLMTLKFKSLSRILIYSALSLVCLLRDLTYVLVLTWSKQNSWPKFDSFQAFPRSVKDTAVHWLLRSNPGTWSYYFLIPIIPHI